jgi:hypothetical protein
VVLSCPLMTESGEGRERREVVGNRQGLGEQSEETGVEDSVHR